MTTVFKFGARCWIPLAVLALMTAVRADVPAVQAGRYALTTQMVLPHLDEMRRISKHEHACIGDGEAARFFPVLRQPAMTGCKLEPRQADDATREYALKCDPINGASGTARLTFGDERVKGVLDAKMGGKNMTFSQHVEALREGSCEAP